MIDTAVILGAGLGARLGDTGRARPKGFIELGHRPIVEESVLRLRSVGVTKIVVVTGYLSIFYDSLARHYPETIRTVHNSRFAESGSLYSLALARDAVARSPFLLLESDLIYEPRALEVLLEGSADAVLLSGPTGAGDEVYVETVGGHLVDMSKDRASLSREPAGELVGISRLSSDVYHTVLDYAYDAFESTLMLDYETDGLVAAGRKRPIQCPLVDDLVWAEIDDSCQLQRATEAVYPMLPAVG